MRYTASDLHVAIYACDIKLVAKCVKNKDIINSFWRGCTPVSSALYLQRYAILEVLVTNGASVNLITRNNKMEPPLFAACRLRDSTAIHIIINAPDLNIDQQDFFGRTALWAASRYCTADIVELLLNRGAKINDVYDCNKKHPIYAALQQNKKDGGNVIRLLVRRGSSLNSVCAESPLKWALRHADRETFCLLIKAGCQIKPVDWLSNDKLPIAWQNDIPFCEWINMLKSNPSSLLHITACFIRNILSTKWKSLQRNHINSLNLPVSLTNLLLFET